MQETLTPDAFNKRSRSLALISEAFFRASSTPSYPNSAASGMCFSKPLNTTNAEGNASFPAMAIDNFNIVYLILFARILP